VQLVEYPHLSRFGTLSRLLFLGPYLHPPDFLSGCDLPTADAGMVRFPGTELIVFVGPDGCDSFLAFTHLAFCACAIFRREAAEIVQVGNPEDIPQT
jgi:hypothetical protein